MYLICINLGLGRYTPSALVDTNQIHHSYRCYNYNVEIFHWCVSRRYHHVCVCQWHYHHVCVCQCVCVCVLPAIQKEQVIVCLITVGDYVCIPSSYTLYVHVPSFRLNTKHDIFLCFKFLIKYKKQVLHFITYSRIRKLKGILVRETLIWMPHKLRRNCLCGAVR